MAAVKEFTLPDLGEGLTEAEIVRWLVEVGEVVAVDQPVVEVETAKAVVEVPCPYGGVVTARFGAEGDTLAVGRPLVTVAVGADPGAGSGDGDGGSGDGGGPEGSGNVLVGYGTQAAVARRRSRVRAVGAAVGHEPVAGAAPTARGDTGHPDGGPVAVISPLVRRLAREKGLDLRSLTGTGPDGLILRADVDRAAGTATGAVADGAAEVAAEAPSGGPTAQAEQTAAARPSVDGEVRVPLRGIRGAVAEKLARSRREIPDATCWVDADATELLAVRAAMNAAAGTAGTSGTSATAGSGGEGTRISVLALMARIVTAALARHPELNASVDTARGEIVRLPAVHLGFAAQTERGLVVPVVRDAQARTTAQLSAEIGRLTAAARTGSLTPADLTGGTFTLNNYGVFGVDGSTPILNHPEAGMLGVGRIAAKPWVHRGELAVRQVVQLSFTFDHRVCDGGTAGGFLRFVADCVQDPAVLLASV